MVYFHMQPGSIALTSTMVFFIIGATNIFTCKSLPLCSNNLTLLTMINITDNDVDCIATTCPTCVMLIQDNLLQHEFREKVRYVVEIHADSLGADHTI